MSDVRPDATRSEREPVKAVEVSSRSFGSRLRTCFMWFKVVVVVVLVVLFVIVLIQNTEQKTKIWLIVKDWSPDATPVSLIIGASFAGGVVLTLLLMLLRHGSRKQE